jgi:hypothetical protein
MDIIDVDDMKWTMRIIAKFAQRKLAAEFQKKYSITLEKGQTFIDYIHNDLKMSTNPGVRKFYKLILEAGHAMPTDYHSSTICDLGAFALWTMYKDTAYRDPFFWILDQLQKDPEFEKDIKEFVKDPSDWYCPQWIRSKNDTERMRKANEISALEMSSAEARFVPELQVKEINEMLSKELERQKQRKL